MHLQESCAAAAEVSSSTPIENNDTYNQDLDIDASSSAAVAINGVLM
jgi:hypothetical protein